jgi:LPXTG-motif cell wall-anchored protein
MKRVVMIAGLLTALLISMATSGGMVLAQAADTAGVTVSDQESDGTRVTVDEVVATQAGWIVIHQDADGQPGAVIGQTGVPVGTTNNVIVFLTEAVAGDTPLWAMLHVDEGEAGVYEFPEGPDVPARVNNTIVMAPFTASAPGGQPSLADIVDTAAANEDFSTLVTAVQEADLVDELQGEGPFTVFAPTNEAFDALPEGTLDALLADPEGDLAQILLYHVVDGAVMSGDLSDGMEVETLQGETLTIRIEGDTVMVNGSTVVIPDIETANGVIHVIDSVLLPPAEEVETAEATPTPVAEEEGEVTGIPASDEEAAATPVAEEEAAATPTPMAEEETAAGVSAGAAPAAGAAAEKGAEAAPAAGAPKGLPDTGGETTSAATTVVVVMAVLLVLAGGVYASRRHHA